MRRQKRERREERRERALFGVGFYFFGFHFVGLRGVSQVGPDWSRLGLGMGMDGLVTFFFVFSYVLIATFGLQETIFAWHALSACLWRRGRGLVRSFASSSSLIPICWKVTHTHTYMHACIHTVHTIFPSLSLNLCSCPLLKICCISY